MVGPISPEERTSAMVRLKIATVLLVGVSGGLIALHSGAMPLVLVGATIGGLLLGVLLTWYLTRILR